MTEILDKQNVPDVPGVPRKEGFAIHVDIRSGIGHIYASNAIDQRQAEGQIQAVQLSATHAQPCRIGLPESTVAYLQLPEHGDDWIQGLAKRLSQDSGMEVRIVLQERVSGKSYIEGTGVYFLHPKLEAAVQWLNAEASAASVMSMADPNQDKKQCNTCYSIFDNDSPVYILEPCGHTLCRACKDNWFSSSSENRDFPIKCTWTNKSNLCGEPVALEVVKHCCGSYSNYEKLARSALDRYMAANVDKFAPCYTPNCGQVGHKDSDDVAFSSVLENL
jgi:hypothetical protein